MEEKKSTSLESFDPSIEKNESNSPPTMMSECYASCPASTVTIQPPPFVLNIPGPALYCPDQVFGIEQHNPCAGFGGMVARGGGGIEVVVWALEDLEGPQVDPQVVIWALEDLEDPQVVTWALEDPEVVVWALVDQGVPQQV
ncbi:glycine-rich cell wall structural protein-like [Crotalus adamanteus]|uniref:Glycine-rich cell wall structural protein-like n=1 Tax=Crotalus adamanteus TaxID=8729 RepID=A0AAW1ANX4_CROAD